MGRAAGGWAAQSALASMTARANAAHSEAVTAQEALDKARLALDEARGEAAANAARADAADNAACGREGKDGVRSRQPL